MYALTTIHETDDPTKVDIWKGGNLIASQPAKIAYKKYLLALRIPKNQPTKKG